MLKRLPVNESQSGRRPCEGSEDQMPQLALATIIADARPRSVLIERSWEAPSSNAAVIQMCDPAFRVIPRHLAIDRVADGFGVIGILQPGKIAFDIVEQTAAAID